jgi:predicted secreted Zn-dependent protease
MVRSVKIAVILLAVALTAAAGEENHDSAGRGRILSGARQDKLALPVVNEKYEYYEVCGCCEKDVQCDLQKKCIRWKDGKKYDSVTNWKVKWDYSYNRTPGACTADSILVTVDVVFHLPKWVRTSDAPQPLVEKWENYLAKLMTHEKGHRDRAVEAATGLVQAVADVPPARTCAELDHEVHTLCRTRMEKLIEDQKDYDTATRHGATQGAVFP